MALNNGWLRIDDVTGTGSTTIYATILERNTSRTTARSAVVNGLLDDYGATAVATFVQSAMPAFITITKIEDTKGTVFWTPDNQGELGSSGGEYYIFGTANTNALYVREDTYTDIESRSGLLRNEGFLLTDYDGVDHAGTNANEVFATDYGAEGQWAFKVPFTIGANTSGGTIQDIGIDFYDYNPEQSSSGVHAILQIGQAYTPT